ncbi:MAG: RIP metalloprotease RseP [Gemmatimonadetes bacterium]|nr:RIP metalloprotease RseP [Gemmatimonadota bacterium]
MTVLATIVVLGVLIFIHELGHFLAAKSVGVEVQRFSIGLGPRIFGFTRGETEYVLSAIPLGGYVKMGGMEDEVMERLEGEGPAERQRSPRDFDAKPLWARAFVISAGVIMNILFAFVIYTTVFAGWGIPELSPRLGLVRASALPAGTEALAQLPVGSSVVRVGAHDVRTWNEVTGALLEAPVGPTDIVTSDPAATVRVALPAPGEARTAMVSALRPWFDPAVGVVNPSSPAEKGGLETGDRILAVGGEPVASWDDFVDRIQSRPGQRIELLLERDGGQVTRAVTPEPEQEVDPNTGKERTVGKIGIYPEVGDLQRQKIGLVEAVQYGARETWGTVRVIMGFLGDLFTGHVSPRSVGSIVTIGEASGQAAAAGAEMFLQFIALFSVNLAVLNLLPIPVLDGGHLLFLGIEAVRGRALTVEQRLRWSNVGFLIVMGIMLWALSNDFLRLFGF